MFSFACTLLRIQSHGNRGCYYQKVLSCISVIGAGEVPVNQTRAGREILTSADRNPRSCIRGLLILQSVALTHDGEAVLVTNNLNSREV